ncbi:cell wall hydrolase [Erythrobacter litoralis]|uniref:cell wall hydrolase n=1 Tax=Erythrobacter litoralis TaxID=39960 RepID=UPI002435FDF7|nr:cell wall hydrolase [Erythrobacter litoralis]
MFRKTGFSVAAAAAMFLTLAGFEESGANAQNAEHQAITLPSDAELTDEVMPVFVSQEVVQDIPETPEEEPLAAREAASLRELVAEMPAPGELSEEMRCLAGAVFFESRGEPLEGQLAVAQVIVNRTESGQFPSSYCGVVHQRSQFSFVRGGAMPRIRTGTVAWKRATAIARIAHQGLWDSKASDALYFHAKYVKPRWASRKTARATIDSHIFYR